MNKHTKKIISDKDVLMLAKSLFDEFAAAKAKSSTGIEAFGSRFGALLRQKSIILYTESSRDTQKSLSDRIEKLLPLQYAARQTIDTDVPNLIASAVEDGLTFKSFKEDFKNYLLQLTSRRFDVYLPNNLFSLQGISEIKIGPVTILDGTSVNSETSSKLQEISDVKTEDVQASSHFDGNKITITYNNSFQVSPPSSPVMWKVSLDAHPQNADEEALWKIKVACGLIRMIGKSWPGSKPYGNRLQRHPTVNDPNLGETLMRITDTNVTLGGGNIYFRFEIDSTLKSEIEDKKAQEVINHVMYHNPNSVGERVYLALAWIASARHMKNKSEKLLATMTAMEAIFTRGKDAPVNETIARLGSVILANTVADRQGVAKTLKGIYEYRSATVHNGQRTATETVTATALHAVEMIVGRIMSEVDLTSKADKFIEGLVKASFGSEWPDMP